jgi:hypothetical protein
VRIATALPVLSGMPPALSAMRTELRRLGWLVGMLWVAAPVWAGTYTAKVRWQPSTDPTVAGYHVYTRMLTGSYGTPQDAGNPTPAADGTMSCLVTGLDSAVGYAFAVTAYESNGNESAFSNELTLPPQPTTTTTSTMPRPSTTSTSTTSTSTTSRTAPPSTTTTSTMLRPSTTSTSTTSTSQTVPTSTTTTTARGTTTTLPSCRSTPRAGCQTAPAQYAPLLLGNGRLRWSWRNTATITARDFGDPMMTTTYLLCIYDASGLRVSAQAPAGGMCEMRPCWRVLGTQGFRYGDRDALPDGLTKVLLEAGRAGRARIQVNAGTANLHLPALPLTTPVQVQLQEADSNSCWEAMYGTPITNTASEFRAKSD